MYCVKCGVELADSERSCPLCKTPVYYPGLSNERERPYPEFIESKDELNPRGISFIFSFLFAIAAIISVFCDINLNGSFDWAGYVIGGLILSYVVLILPSWFRRPNPAVFVPVDFAVSGLLLLYIDISMGGGWFLPFALPVLGAITLIICAVVILIYYLRCGHLYIFGGASIALGLVSLMIEMLIHSVFLVNHTYLLWSVYPLVALSMIGIMLIVIAIVKPFRDSLRKIFAI